MGNKVKKVKDPNRLGFKNYAGGTMMWAVSGIGAALMTSWFMQYLTDYAGIGTWGAVLGTVLLLAVRIFDAVNDPIQGVIIDKAKVTRFGKYKPFLIASVILTAGGCIGSFFLPSVFADNPVMICVWVLFFYLCYDLGESWFAPNLLYRTMTDSLAERSKLIVFPRILTLVIGIVMSSLIATVNSINVGINNMHTSFGLTVTLFVGVCAVIALVGLLLVKEKHPEAAATEKSDVKVRFADFFVLLKENKALRIKVLSDIFSGFIWTFLFATCLYYIKWGFCADLTTGEVDSAKYGTYSLISSMMMLLPIILGTVIANPLMKLFKSPIRLYRAMMLIEAISCGLLFVFQVVGLLASIPFLFFVCMAITATAIGVHFIPQEVINMETMDYNIYKFGKDRSALCNACQKFINKAQTAVSASLVGAILIAIGYVVDSATDTYIGELSALPTMLTWFIVIMGLVPCILGVVSFIIMKFYPVTSEVREEMHKALHPENAPAATEE